MNLARQAAQTYGLDALNSLTKYPSILTLHAFGEKGRLTEKHTTTNVYSLPLYATEKVDGTNVRLLFFPDGSYIVGGRETFLHLGGELLFDPSNGIVAGLQANLLGNHAHLPSFCAQRGGTAPLTVVYGEVYGGKINDHKQYGSGLFGFRVFDVAVFESQQELDWTAALKLPEISLWREAEWVGGMNYGQPFLDRDQLAEYCQARELALVPEVNQDTYVDEDWDCAQTHWYLTQVMPTSLATLNASAVGKPEGIVLASADRSVRVKLRFEDYERTLKTTKLKV